MIYFACFFFFVLINENKNDNNLVKIAFIIHSTLEVEGLMSINKEGANRLELKTLTLFICNVSGE